MNVILDVFRNIYCSKVEGKADFRKYESKKRETLKT